VGGLPVFADKSAQPISEQGKGNGRNEGCAKPYNVFNVKRPNGKATGHFMAKFKVSQRLKDGVEASLCFSFQSLLKFEVLGIEALSNLKKQSILLRL
jgi:hypothetical protein